MRDVEKKNPGTTEIVERGWWEERTSLEKVGVVAVGIAAGAVAAALVFPTPRQPPEAARSPRPADGF